MSALKKEVISVAVTDGDAIATNRLSGKSNTGTYFISSMKNWGMFSSFFNESEPTLYMLDLRKIYEYKVLFENICFTKRNLYSDKMKNFEDICNSLLSYETNPIIKFELRINDSRVFLKFSENNNEIEYALRGIIYSNLTNLVFEKTPNSSKFYLEVNTSNDD